MHVEIHGYFTPPGNVNGQVAAHRQMSGSKRLSFVDQTSTNCCHKWLRQLARFSPFPSSIQWIVGDASCARLSLHFYGVKFWRCNCEGFRASGTQSQLERLELCKLGVWWCWFWICCWWCQSVSASFCPCGISVSETGASQKMWSFVFCLHIQRLRIVRCFWKSCLEFTLWWVISCRKV